MTRFADLELDPKVLQAVVEAGYETPTPIQAQAIPHALANRDVLGIAQTGTGKTASFVLPMLTILAKGRARARMPRTLVLCPTRELAAQVAENFTTYSKHMKLTMALLIGGTSFKDQDRLIDRGVDVLIATPGRLLDHFERGKLMLTGIEIMVVDEADRMLDMGFIPDIERIFKLTPFTRQTLFFSATMAPEITRITQEFLSNPVRVEVAAQATTSETIEQSVCILKPSRRDAADKEKRALLRALIEGEGDKLTNGIIFCNRKRDVDLVAKSLKKHGYDAHPIHGDLDQSIRTRTLDGFREGKIRLLIASDVAARGLDIPNVSHVFNFDVPTHSEDYVHRIGRTGRAGRKGISITLCLSSEEKYLDQIEALVKLTIPRRANPLEAGAAATPARVEKAQSAAPAEDKPRSRSRSRARAPSAAPTEETPKAAVDPTPSAPAPEAAPERAKEPARERPKQTPKRDEGRGRSSSNRSNQRGGNREQRGPRVVGLGEHVPAFLMRELRVGEMLTPATDEAETAEPEVAIVAPVAPVEIAAPTAPVETAPTEATKPPARKPSKPRTRKAAAKPAEAAPATDEKPDTGDAA